MTVTTHMNPANRYATGIRGAMDRRLPLPRKLLDWFTGKPLLDPEQTIERKDPLAIFLRDLGMLGLSTSTSIFGLTYLPLPASLPLALTLALIQIGILRKMQTLYGHEASHGNFFPRGDPRRDIAGTVWGLSLNDFIGEAATAIALVQNEEDYGEAHDRHHDLQSFTTLRDDDARDVLAAGFSPGQPVATYWRQYWWDWISPRFHLRQLKARFLSNFVSARRPRKVMAAVSLGALGALALIVPLYAWVGAILLPWTWGYHIAGLSQVLNRHAWMQSEAGAADLQDYAERTWGRFNGIPLPAEGLAGWRKYGAWGLWSLEMLLLELPVRLASWSFDLQAHDYHHLEWHGPEAFVDDWTTMTARRQSAIDRGQDPFGMADRELWGWRNAMAHAFEKLAAAPKLV